MTAPTRSTPSTPYPLRRHTQRQEQLLRALARDPQITLVEIARKLGISVHTVRGYLQQIAWTIPNPHHLPALRLVRAYAIAGDYARRAP